jgi:hypothetical protein
MASVTRSGCAMRLRWGASPQSLHRGACKPRISAAQSRQAHKDSQGLTERFLALPGTGVAPCPSGLNSGFLIVLAAKLRSHYLALELGLMPTEIRQSAPQLDPSDAVRARHGARAQGFEYGERPSIAGRAFRALFRFIVAVLIGVGLTLAWQSHGDEGVKLARSYAPSLARLLPVPKTNTPPSNQMSAAAIATEVRQQLEPIAREFDVAQRSIQQLATSTQQLATKIDELAANQVTYNRKAVEEDNRQTTSSPPPGARTTANAGQQVSSQTTSSPPPGARTAANAGQQVSSQTTSSPPPGARTTANAGQQVSDKCDVEACKQAYFTFNPADCTYQPKQGPRRICDKGTPPRANTAQAPGQQPGRNAGASPARGAARAPLCNVEACKAAYFTFNPDDCTFQPNNGPRRLCTK